MIVNHAETVAWLASLCAKPAEDIERATVSSALLPHFTLLTDRDLRRADGFVLCDASSSLTQLLWAAAKLRDPDNQ